MNVTFKLTAGPGEFYLRLYRQRGRSREQIEGEIAALLAFRPACEVYVAKPQKLRTGGHIFECIYNGETRLACLFVAARGRQAEADCGDMRQLGVALAVMHSQMPPAFACGRPFQPANTVGEAVQLLSQRGAKFRRICAEIKNAGAAILANLNRQAPLRTGFCHGDAWCGNVRLSGPRTTFFDFDDCFDGPMVADLIPQIAWLWHSNRVEFPALVRVLLDAYTSCVPLAEAEVAAIPSLAQLHEIASLDFLARYCTLEPPLWDECLQRSMRMLEDWSPGGAASAHIAPLAGAARMARRWVA